MGIDSRAENVRSVVQSRKFLAVIAIISLLGGSIAYVAGNSSFSNETYVPVASWGKQGDLDGELNKPRGITVDNKGFVYVVDAGNARVQKFTDNGKFVALIGNGTDGARQFKMPYGVTLDSDGNIYVTDQMENNVQVFTAEGNFTASWGNLGLRKGEFKNPLGIATDAEDNVYVVDNGNSRIQKFSRDGKFILEWGLYGPGAGQFTDPFAITIDPHGMVYVVDNVNNRVQKFTSEGKFIESWGKGGKIRISIDPVDLVSDQDGSIYIAAGSSSKVQKVNLEGSLLDEFMDTTQNYPISGIAVDALDYVYVSDYENNRIQKFGTVSSTWPTFQDTMGVISKRLDKMVKGSTSETFLLPASVHGTPVISGNATDVFGDNNVMGDEPSIEKGKAAKITSITIQNKDPKSEHKVRVQLGYAGWNGEFQVRQDIKVILKAKGVLGDGVTLPLPEPFYVPGNQIKTGGTNILVRIAADSPGVVFEVSVSGILNP